MAILLTKDHPAEALPTRLSRNDDRKIPTWPSNLLAKYDVQHRSDYWVAPSVSSARSIHVAAWTALKTVMHGTQGSMISTAVWV